MTVSQRILEIMENKHIKQKTLADYTGISTSAISDWKKKGTNPSVDKIVAISECLDVSVDYLLGRTDNKNGYSNNNINNSDNFAFGENAQSVTFMTNQQIAQRIKDKCKESKISVNQLTQDCGLGKSLIYDMESKNSSPSVDKIMTIADYLDCSIEYLLGVTEKSENNISNSNVTAIGHKSSGVVNVNSSSASEQDEMTAELLKRFHNLSFDEKLEVFNYIKNLNEG